MQRKGAKHMAFYRIVAADSRSPRDGRFIEQLGYYDPLTDPPAIEVDTEKVIDWFKKGALPSETVRGLFSRVGIMETWNEIGKGKSLDELRHIEDDARKKIEAQAVMARRTREKQQKEGPEAADEAQGEKPVPQPDSEEGPTQEDRPVEEPAAGEAEEEASDEKEVASEPETEGAEEERGGDRGDSEPEA